MALENKIKKFNIDFNEAYYRIESFSIKREINGNLDISIAIDIWANKDTRDNFPEEKLSVDYISFKLPKGNDIGSISDLYKMIKENYYPNSKDILEKEE